MNLHLDDHPATLQLLYAVIGGRRENPDGYEPHEHGMAVDWDALDHSWLSSTEKPVVHIARGLARLEYYGGNPAVNQAVLTSVHSIVGSEQ